eukprot:TRINITY_DN2218_c0_g1_i1.p1 TRINITY_DN2218_c0_g1~~TRINITY_DN2218_c0_g1_i1.p1  ORF type:complete len:880 (+),score=144.33 TRINITY_DN2218_c0_g1_i1:203-2842(+)
MGLSFELELSHLFVFVLGFAVAWFIFRKQGRSANNATPSSSQQATVPKITTQAAPSTVTSTTTNSSLSVPPQSHPTPTVSPPSPIPAQSSSASTTPTTTPSTPKKDKNPKNLLSAKRTAMHKRVNSESATSGRTQHDSNLSVTQATPEAWGTNEARKSLPTGEVPSVKKFPRVVGGSGSAVGTPVSMRGPAAHLKTTDIKPTPNIEALKAAFANPVTGVQMRERKKKLGKSHKVFSGSDAVDWLLANADSVDRKKAIDIGVRLWASGLFRHVSHRHRPFCDGGHELFRFITKADHEGRKIKSMSKRVKHRSRHIDVSTSLNLNEPAPAKPSPLADSLLRTSAWIEVSEAKGWTRRWCAVQKEVISTPEGASTSSLLVYDQADDKVLLELMQQMTAPTSGLKIKSRRYGLLKSYSKCFAGKRGVDWLVTKRPEVESREQAVALMNKLIQKGLLFSAVADKYVFKDNSNYYTFSVPVEDDETKEDKEGRTSSAVDLANHKETAYLLGRIPLDQNLLFKLKKEGSFVFVILYHTHRSAVLQQDGVDVHPGILAVEDPKNFVIRLHERDESNVKQWIYALQSAVLIEGISPEEYCYDSGEESDEFFSDTDELDSDVDIDNVDAMDVPKEVLTSAEQAVLAEVKNVLQQEKESGVDQGPVDLTTVPDAELIKYIRARKLEVGPSVILIKAGVPYRHENNFDNIKITDVLEEVRGGMCRLIPDARDKEGRVILVMLPQCYQPARSPPLALVRAMYYLLDLAANDDEHTQRVGFSVMVDCKGSKYANFDAAMPKVLVNGIVGKYPARVGHVIIVNTPWFFRFIWAVLRPLLSDVLAAKFHIIRDDEIVQYVDPSSLLPMHGGTSTYDHEAWIRSRFEKEGIPYVPP